MFNGCYRFHEKFKEQKKCRGVLNTPNHQRNNPDGHNAVAPPDSMPNSEVKCCNADGSVGFPNVRVGHHQVQNYKPQLRE